MDEKKARVREELDACLKRCEAILHGEETDTSSAADAAPSPQGEGCEGMTAKREGRILEWAINKWGQEAQTIKAIEEMAELTQALIKYVLCGYFGIGAQVPEGITDEALARYCDEEYRRNRDHILEELADVIIMTKQLELIYGDVTEWEIQKLERLERLVQG